MTNKLIVRCGRMFVLSTIQTTSLLRKPVSFSFNARVRVRLVHLISACPGRLTSIMSLNFAPFQILGTTLLFDGCMCHCQTLTLVLRFRLLINVVLFVHNYDESVRTMFTLHAVLIATLVDPSFRLYFSFAFGIYV
jgi:hypothetical protein